MIVIESYKGKSVTEQRAEIVERKGLGHPDTICDSIMETISVALSQEYIKEFGVVLHHNIDKGLLAAGRTAKWFGGGNVLKPMELIIGDRATFKVGKKIIPVAEIAITAAKQWITHHLKRVDPDHHIKYRIVLAPGSQELTDIFIRPGQYKGANDTSAAAGYYPLTPTEQLVLSLEKYLNSKKYKSKFPATGEDIKIMAVRNGKKLQLTVAMPLLAEQIFSESEYFVTKGKIVKDMSRFLAHYEIFENIRIHYNSLDVPGRGLNGIYLSLLGTSAEDADSGQVGRGNRVNGLIAINRPLGTEAAAGKNPVSHVGKIYNVFAHHIAREIYEVIEGIEEVNIYLSSRIGAPIDKPQLIAIRVLLAKGRRIRDISKPVHDLLERKFSSIDQFCRKLSNGKFPVC